MPGYADVEDPVALLNRAPDTSGGPTVEQAVRDAGFEVQAVNWVWEKIVGESLVDSIIKPITGDFEKIAQQAGEWKNVKDALQAIRNNLNAGLDELGPGWQGEAADKFRNLIGTTWTLGIEADAQAANLIGFALGKVADGSKRACDQALHLIKMLVDKLIEAAAMLPIPVVGWGRAVKLVYDGIQIYNAIMQLINGIKMIIDGAQQVITGIQQVGTALSKIKDIHNLNDALNVANEAGEGVANIHGGAQTVAAGASQTTHAAGSLAQHGASAADNARGLHDERAAARTHDDGGTGPAGTTTSRRPGSQQQTDPSARPGDPNRTRTPVPYRRCDNDPIDISSGEMVLQQTDVQLPGLLPLMLRRTHVSSYRAGRSFGRSWASTVDQRLEFDADGVVFVADDGMLLVYPEPAAGEVLPVVGPRWPLARTADGFTVTIRETQQLLHFPAGDTPIRPLAAITDRHGNRIDLDRDATGMVTAVRHDGGYHVEVDSTERRITGLRLRSTQGDITLARFGYNATGDLSEVVNSSNRALRFDYDTDGRITQWTDRNGEWYRYFYDADGRCVANQGSGGFLNGTFSYDDETRTTRFTDALGHTTTYLLDARGNLVSETTPLGETTVSQWDDRDNLAARTDPLGRTTRYTHDEHGNLTAITRPDGAQLLFEYDAFGRPTTAVNPEGDVRRHEYDERGNLVTVVDPDGATTRYTHTDRGHVASVTDALGNAVRFATNPAGIPVAVTNPLGATTRYDVDPLGRVVALTDPMGGVTRFGWTVEGQLTSRTQPDGATERWLFDGEGNQVEHIDAVGHVVRTNSTHFNLPAVEVGPDGGRLEFGYDANLRLVSVTNQQGLVWRYEYDPVGRLVRETDFNGRVVGYGYDAAGQLIERTNGAGQTVHLGRDPMGNIVERRSAEGVTELRYDGNGQLVWARNDDAELEFRRDAVGRVLAETVNGATVTSEYDALGRRTLRRTSTGAQSRWEFDAAGSPVRLHTGDRSLAFAYNPAGREVERSLDGRVRLVQTWDVNQRLIEQALTAPDARPVQQRHYHYHPDNQLAAIQDRLAGDRRFQLDPTGQVIGVDSPDVRERYGYDAAGNVTSAVWSGAAAQGARTYRGTLIAEAGDDHYQHDAQGRVILRQHRRLSRKPDTWHYAWDADDRLVGVVTPDSTRWRYRYDPLGRRIAKERLDAGGTVAERVDFTWDGTILAEQSHSGRITTWEFDPRSYRPLTQTERAADVDERFYAIVTDLIGTPTELVDANGDVSWLGRTNVWGVPISGRQGADTPLRFPGQYHDPETGLHYNMQRYYDPLTGRFGSADPMGLMAGAAPHSYVHNPTGFIDPLGLTGNDDIVWVDPNSVNFSQRTISPNDYAQRMSTPGGWDWNRPDAPLRVMEVNGQLVSYDNRRLDAARDAGLTRVPVRRVNPNDPHPDSTTGRTWGEQFQRRFNDKRNRREGGPVPETGLNERPRVVCP